MPIPTILVACGAGIATSTIVSQRVEALLKENKIRAQLVQCTISEASTLQYQAVLVISTTILPTRFTTPVVIATPYITGIGMDKIDQQILMYLD
ncbi:PTS sugar transporter subunit IIB [Exiguobacterium sp. s22]|uniref:PTS sugar transporter subunit IIB n=1 Tax=Exiguobacterium sp. s22 TaxID=2751272 RepID=UPI001BE771B5